MPLRTLSLRGTYSSEDGALLREFYLPALSQSILYNRAVGYFSAGMLSFAAQGLSGLISRQGRMRLLIGEPLDPEEYDAVKKGHELRSLQEKLALRFRLVLDNAEHPIFKHRLQLLSWLVGANLLEVRIAVTIRGMYHEKLGILEDDHGDQIVFHGSANETAAALLPDFNFESIAVYPSWKTEIFAEYGQPYAERFERLWNGTARSVTTVPLPSAAYEALQSYYKDDQPPPPDREEALAVAESRDPEANPNPSLPDFIADQPYQPMAHQKAALSAWRASDYYGIFALATGAGKTITALHGAVKLSEYHRSMGRHFILVVAVPYQVLADQWCAVMTLFNIEPLRCYRSRASWLYDLHEAISDLQLSAEPRFVAAVVVNATLARDDFRQQIRRVDANDLMFVGDECHHHATGSFNSKLPDARYRLGLSATPWSATDEDRKEALKGYYGGVAATYSLGRALADGVLTPYDYQIHPVTLTAHEADEYERLSSDISKLMAIKEQGGRIRDEELTYLLMTRARLLGSAEGKFATLETLTRQAGVAPHTLFYCGDGSTEDDSDADSLRDVERVARVLSTSGWKTSRFTAEESHTERLRIMENFRYGHIDAVVAIRVLDEGFDMPSCREAYLLASSRNNRQFVQRRGRILRQAPNKDRAVIHDFLVLPLSLYRSSALTGLVWSELSRAVEFARFAANKPERWKDIQCIADDFSIDLDVVLEDVKGKEVIIE